MIEVIILHKESGAELGRIEITNEGGNLPEFGDYSVQLGVERISGVGLHKRGIMGFPRTKYNVLALLKQALDSLDPQDLELDGDYEERSYAKKRLSLLRGFL